MNTTPKLIKFTKEGLEDLKKELESIKIARPAAVMELKRAREMGDLSENGLYTAAKGRLRSMDSRIERIDRMIKLADVYESPKDHIGVGSKITVEQNDKQIEYSIVGDFEADPLNHKISSKSPIGMSLIGKKIGEEAQIQTPKGTTILKVLKIS